MVDFVCRKDVQLHVWVHGIEHTLLYEVARAREAHVLL